MDLFGPYRMFLIRFGFLCIFFGFFGIVKIDFGSFIKIFLNFLRSYGSFCSLWHVLDEVSIFMYHSRSFRYCRGLFFIVDRHCLIFGFS